MKLLQITPGTGTFHCGGCLRDNWLVGELRQRGHEVVVAPMYLPLVVDEPLEQKGPLFFGGINAYLQQKWALFRHTPRWVDRLLDARWLLTAAARRAHMTTPQDHGAMALSMLRGKEGRQVKELERLTAWAAGQGPFAAVLLSNALLLGLAPALIERLGAPILCSLQGEDLFLDRLPPPYRQGVWDMVAQHAAQVDHLIAPSTYYAQMMAQRLGLKQQRITVVPDGIPLHGHEPATESPSPPTIGFLARMHPDKGLDILVEAFLMLCRTRPPAGPAATAHLCLVGACTDGDRRYVDGLKKQLQAAGLARRVQFHPNVDRARKLALLPQMSVLAVPVRYSEAFGLYVVEALASGVPVVIPESGALPELVAATGGGWMHRPGDAADLAAKLAWALDHPQECRAAAQRGNKVVRERYHAGAMAEGIARLVHE